MRQLTVRREKTFVGSAAKAHVYIADPQGDTVISGMNCSKLGELRNNEEKTFEITEEATRVFVTADKLSQSFCKDSAAVPAGTEPVLLTGKNKFDPGRGNPFRFDGEPDDFALLDRNSGGKKGSLIMIIALVVGIIAGYFGMRAILNHEKKVDVTFHGLTMQLTDKYTEDKDDSIVNENSRLFAKGKSSLEVAVHLLREPTVGESEILADLSEKEYAELMLKTYGWDDKTSVEQKDGLTFFKKTETLPVSGKDTEFYYTYYIFKGKDAFYRVMLYTVQKSVYEGSTFSDIIKTVKVK